MTEKLQVTYVFEILGRPAAHIVEALNLLVTKLGNEKGVKVTNQTVREPVLVKDSQDIYTTFAEVDAELESWTNYFGVLFAYMPAHVEIVSPQEVRLKNADFNELGNKLLARLHDYDAITKKSLFERDFVIKELQKVAPDVFKQFIQPEAKEEQNAEKDKKKGKKKKD
jgi:hypothetical protein